MILTKAFIIDKPLYKHRGILLDTSRNFLPLKSILETIDGMASSKLNVLHWHITDAQSFPLEIKEYPKMSQYGSYSPNQIYKMSQIEFVIKYAHQNGVRVIMEIDAPAHAGYGWQWGREDGLGDLAVCVNKQPWRNYCIQPPCGQLNPVNPNVSFVMESVYQELINLNPTEINFHMGGDEVHFGCWESIVEIVLAMKLKGYPINKYGFLQLWADFQDEMLQTYDKSFGNNQSKFILWSSDLTDPINITQYLSPKRYVIQTWVEKESSLNKDLLEKGYQLIVSTKNAWYFDHGFWYATIVNCFKIFFYNLVICQ